MANSANRGAMLLASAVTGLLTLGVPIGTAMADHHAENVHCYGVNKCKGAGDCGGKGHSCAGKNACKGKGWKSMTAEECEKAKEATKDA